MTPVVGRVQERRRKLTCSLAQHRQVAHERLSKGSECTDERGR